MRVSERASAGESVRGSGIAAPAAGSPSVPAPAPRLGSGLGSGVDLGRLRLLDPGSGHEGGVASGAAGGGAVAARLLPLPLSLLSLLVVVSSWYSSSTLTLHTSWVVPVRMFSEVSRAVSMEWSALL